MVEIDIQRFLAEKWPKSSNIEQHDRRQIPSKLVRTSISPRLLICQNRLGRAQFFPGGFHLQIELYDWRRILEAIGKLVRPIVCRAFEASETGRGVRFAPGAVLFLSRSRLRFLFYVVVLMTTK